MSHDIQIEPLNTLAFAPFGDVIDNRGEPTMLINNGQCARYHDRATLNFAEGGRAGISVFDGKPYCLPHRLTLVERHPMGSQAFIPMSRAPFLVIVARDEGGVPVDIRAFATECEQGVNIHRGVWHGVLTPLENSARFAVVDWIGEAVNLEEYHFDIPWTVQARI